MPTMLEALARDHFSAAFFVRISGIPYLFSNVAPPAGWETVTGNGLVNFDGDTYEWSQTLLLDGIGGVSHKSEPKAGLGAAGQKRFSFLLTGTGEDATQDLWLDLLVRDPGRTDKAASTLAAQLDPDVEGVAEVITLTDASDFPTTAGGSPIYIGLETIRAGSASNTATTLVDIYERGSWGSWPMLHRVLTDVGQIESAGAPYVTTWPLVWHGRVLDLMMVHGYRHLGAWKSHAENADGATNVFSGVINGVKEGDDTLTVSHAVASLDQILAKKIGTRLPEARLWQPQTLRERCQAIYVGEHNNLLTWEWFVKDGSAAGTSLRHSNVTLKDDTGALGEALAEGLYTIRKLGRCIERTIKDEATLPGGATDINIRAFPNGEGKDGRAGISMNLEDGIGGSKNYTLYLSPTNDNARVRSVIRDFGFKKEAVLEYNEDVVSATHVVFKFAESDEAPPVLVWPPRGAVAPARIYYHQLQRVDLPFQVTTGWESDEGLAIPAVINVADLEWMYVTGSGSDSPVDNNGSGDVPLAMSINYLTVANKGARGVYNTGDDKERTVAFDPNSDKKRHLRQVIALVNTSLQRALPYLAIGGSGTPGTLHADWDQGWYGSGAALPARLFDLAAILGVGAVANTRRSQIAIEKETSLRDWLRDELLAAQVLMLPRADWEGGGFYALTWVEHGQPMEHELAAMPAFDQSKMRTLGGRNVGFDRDEGKLITRVEVQCAFDYGEGRFRLTVKNEETTADVTWGGETMRLSLKSIGQTADDARTARLLAAAVFGVFGRPYVIYELDGARAITWTYQVGESVLLTNTVLPKLDRPGRGVVDLPARIMVSDDEYLPDGETCARKTAIAHLSSQRQGAWAPSARLYASADGGTTWQVRDHGYSDGDAGDAFDLSWFKVGETVRLRIPGFATILTREIASVTPSTGSDDGEIAFTVATSTGWDSYELVMVGPTYDSAAISATQKKFAHWSDGAGNLDLSGGGADAAFVYY